MKKIIFLLAFVCVSFIANAQIKNTFIQQGKFVLYPGVKIKDYNDKDYGMMMDLAYMPLNRLEIRPGITFTFGQDVNIASSLALRYYLLKSKFTIFPEFNSSYCYTTDYFRYGYGFGVGYYGLFKRIGIDFLVISYSPFVTLFSPRFKLKILLGKIEE